MRILVRGLIAALLGLWPASAEDAPPPQPTLTAAVDAAIAKAAEEAAGDPAKARAMVAARVKPAAYDGVLKGPRGAWLTMEANSADQALLVSTLLGDGATKRFAWCDSAPAPAAIPFVSPLDRAETLASGQPDKVKALIAELVRIRSARMADASVQKADLQAALAEANLPPAQDSDAPSRHVWLQVEQGGSWQDVDTTTADGSPPCAASETAAALPDDMFVRVRLSVEVETKTEDRLSVAEALAFEGTMADLATTRITFGFAETINRPEERPADADLTVPYTPVFMVDGRETTGTPFRLRAVTASLGGAISDVGGLLDEPAADAPPPVDVTAATLVVKLTGPGVPAEPLRSEIFDRIGPSGRAAGAETAPVQDMAIANADYAALAAIWQVGLLTGSGDPQITGDIDFDPMTNEGLFGQVDLLLRAYPGIRRGFGGSNALPQVLLGGLTPIDGEDEMPVTQLVLDALYVPSRATGHDAAIEDAAASLAAESMLVALAGGREPPLSAAQQVFAAAKADGIPLALVRSETDLESVGGLSADAAARMAYRVRAGSLLITPQYVPSVDGTTATAWWAIDPRTGAVWDEHENGRHTSATERPVTQCPSVSAFSLYRSLGAALVRPIIAVALALSVAGDPAAGKMLDMALKIESADEKTKKAGRMAEMISCAK